MALFRQASLALLSDELSSRVKKFAERLMPSKSLSSASSHLQSIRVCRSIQLAPHIERIMKDQFHLTTYGNYDTVFFKNIRFSAETLSNNTRTSDSCILDSTLSSPSNYGFILSIVETNTHAAVPQTF